MTAPSVYILVCREGAEVRAFSSNKLALRGAACAMEEELSDSAHPWPDPALPDLVRQDDEQSLEDAVTIWNEVVPPTKRIAIHALVVDD